MYFSQFLRAINRTPCTTTICTTWGEVTLTTIGDHTKRVGTFYDGSPYMIIQLECIFEAALPEDDRIMPMALQHAINNSVPTTIDITLRPDGSQTIVHRGCCLGKFLQLMLLSQERSATAEIQHEHASARIEEQPTLLSRKRNATAEIQQECVV